MWKNSIYCLLLLALRVRSEFKHDCSSPPSGIMNDCCDQNIEGDIYHYKECYLDLTSKLGSNGILRGAGEHGGPAGCVAECATKKLEALQKDGRLNETLLNNLQLLKSDNIFFEVHKDARRYCVQEANERVNVFLEIQESFDVVPGQRNCNPISGFFLSCIHTYVFTHCPVWQDNLECNHLKAFYDDCPLNHF